MSVKFNSNEQKSKNRNTEKVGSWRMISDQLGLNDNAF